MGHQAPFFIMIVFSSNVINEHYSVFGLKCKDGGDIESFIVSENVNDIGRLIDRLTDIKVNGEYIVGYNLYNSIYQSLLDDRILVTSLSNSETIDYINNFKRYNSSKVENKYIDLMVINGLNGVHIDYMKYKYGLESVFRDTPGETETHVRDAAQRVKEDLGFIELFYEDSRDALNTRFIISRDYRFDCLNWSGPKIGEEILLSVYAQKINENPNIVRRMIPKPQTCIDFSKLILPYIKFETAAFRDIYSMYHGTIYNGSFSGRKMKMKGSEFSFGLGGLHQCNKGVYETDKEYVIVDFDAKAYLPNLIANNNIYPPHLSSDFCDVYKNHIIKTRAEEEAKINPRKEIIKIYKDAASCIFGLTGYEDSWLYSKEFLYKVTINSQLTIAMFIEKLSSLDLKFIQTNTDGGTVYINKNDLPKFKEAYNWWKETTGFSLKVTLADKVVIYNNNSYIMKMSDGEVVSKGALALDSFPSVITNSVYSHFFGDKNCQEYISSCKDIKEFLIPIKETEDTKIGYSYKEEVFLLSGAIRYYVSTKDSVAIGRISSNNSFLPEIKNNSKQIIVDVIPNFGIEEYNVDTMFYSAKALSIVSDILGGVDNQCKLF